MVEQAKQWLSQWDRNSRKVGAKRGLFLEGRPGIGKTILAYLLAEKYGYRVVEVNTSDERGKESLELILLQSTSDSLLGSNLILIDEVDGIDGRVEKGGTPVILSMLSRTACPIILTANDWKKSLQGIKNRCLVLRMRKLTQQQIYDRLRYIADREYAALDHRVIESISTNVDGDLRAAMNDLESFQLRNVRRTEPHLFDLSKIVTSMDQREVETVLYGINMLPRELIYRLYGFLTQLVKGKKLSPSEAANMAKKLANCDFLLGRADSSKDMKSLFRAKVTLTPILSTLNPGRKIDVWLKPDLSILSNLSSRKKLHSLLKGVASGRVKALYYLGR